MSDTSQYSVGDNVPTVLNKMSDLRFAFSVRMVVWTAAIVAVILLIHLFAPSMMQMNEGEWDGILSYHQTLEAFRVRPIVTNLATGLQESTGMSFKYSFFVLQFILLFLAGPALAIWYKSLGFSERESIIGIALFLLSLPVAMAFFEPVFTWSDILCYVLVPLALASAVKGKLGLLVVTLIPCILEREINIVLLPVVGALAIVLGKAKLRSVVVTCLLSLVTALGIRMLMSGASNGAPEMMLSFNFDGFLRSRDSLFSIWISLGAIWLIGLEGAIRGWASENKQERLIARCGLYLTVAFFVAAIELGKARESRLFMPAAFFLIPLTLMFLRKWKESALTVLNRYGIFKFIAMAVTALAVGILLTKIVFPEFEYRRWHDGNWIWCGMHVAVIIILFVVRLIGKKRWASALAE